MQKKEKKKSIEVKIEHPSVRLTIGAIDRDNPDVFYVSGSTYITPLTEEATYGDSLLKARKGLYRDLSGEVKEAGVLEEDFIFNHSLKTSTLKEGKPSSFTFEGFIKQKRDSHLHFNGVRSMFSKSASSVTDNFVKCLNEGGVSCSKTK